MSIVIRVPSHLGDGVMALPAVRAIAALPNTRVWTEGPGWHKTLYRGCGLHTGAQTEALPARADVAVLLKPSFSAAWAYRRVPRRIGLSWDGRWPLLTDALPPLLGHRSHSYAALAAALGAQAALAPCYEVKEEDHTAAPQIPPNAVLLLPGSASGETVRWGGFAALAELLAAAGRPVFYAGGPAEESWLPALAGRHTCLPTLPLPVLAAVAVQISAVVANDSGLTHLAAAARRAAGVSVQAVHTIFGSTDPALTGAPGGTAHQLSGLPCRPCYRKRCVLGVTCLQIPAAQIAQAVLRCDAR